MVSLSQHLPNTYQTLTLIVQQIFWRGINFESPQFIIPKSKSTCFGIFFVSLHPMDIQSFFISLLNVVCEMAPYLLLGFFIAGMLHVFVPQKFYANYLSRNNKLLPHLRRVSTPFWPRSR